MAIKRLKYCIDNEWNESTSGKYTPVMNPSTGEQIAEAPVCTREEVNAAVASAKKAFAIWSQKPVSVRTQVLFKFRELVNLHFDELSVLLATEMGKGAQGKRGQCRAGAKTTLWCGKTPRWNGRRVA